MKLYCFLVIAAQVLTSTSFGAAYTLQGAPGTIITFQSVLEQFEDIANPAAINQPQVTTLFGNSIPAYPERSFAERFSERIDYDKYMQNKRPGESYSTYTFRLHQEYLDNIDKETRTKRQISPKSVSTTYQEESIKFFMRLPLSEQRARFSAETLKLSKINALAEETRDVGLKIFLSLDPTGKSYVFGKKMTMFYLPDSQVYPEYLDYESERMARARLSKYSDGVFDSLRTNEERAGLYESVLNAQTQAQDSQMAASKITGQIIGKALKYFIARSMAPKERHPYFNNDIVEKLNSEFQKLSPNGARWKTIKSEVLFKIKKSLPSCAGKIATAF